MACMVTQIPTNNVTVAIRIRILIVFHRIRCEHPLPSYTGELAPPSSSSALYLKSEDKNRRARLEGTRGMIFVINAMMKKGL